MIESPRTNDDNVSSRVAFDIYYLGDWAYHTQTYKLIKPGSELQLEHRIGNLLCFFLAHANQVLHKDFIIAAIWPAKSVGDDSLAVAVSQLRKLLADDYRNPKYIKTIPGIGYQFILRASAIATVPLVEAAPANTPAKKYPVSTLVLLVSIIVSSTIALCSFSTSSSEAGPQPTRPHLGGSGLIAQAHKLLSQGNRDELLKSIALYRQILAQNPQQAEAYLGIAEAKLQLLNNHLSDTERDEIRGLLEKALALNPQLARAHMWLAHLLSQYYHQFATAEQHFLTSLSINSQDDWCHTLYEQFLLVHKRFDEARAQITQARDINPLSYPYTYMVWIDLLDKRYEAAARELERISDTEYQDSFFHTAAQNVYWGLHDEHNTYQHMQWFYTAAHYPPEKIAALDALFAQGGINAVYRWLLDNKETANLGQYSPPISWARYAIALDQKELALDYLEQAYSAQQFRLPCALTDPRYDSLRREPRFMALIDKLIHPLDLHSTQTPSP